ncbi:MAG: regulatory particle non-ATPase [Bogoriella megaspora]|nr:MAG: regulatory particle non-ATPase [Bogoriella megaspora]
MSTEAPSDHGLSIQLRNELKEWEKQFTSCHNGRKPNREDIKQDPSIALKYKEYERLRSAPPRRISVNSTSRAPKRQRVNEPIPPPSQTSPEGSVQAIRTPAKFRQNRNDENTVNVTSPTTSPSQALPTFIGPTPQKDGIPLGLFDLLSPEQPSPSTKAAMSRPVLSSLPINVPSTPCKRRHDPTEENEVSNTETRARFTRTPASSGRRYLLDTFVTPIKHTHYGDENRTPSSSRLLRTPAFLRRDSVRLNVLTECDESIGCIEGKGIPAVREPPFKKRKGFGRSLSAIIRGLRKSEDDAFQDEEDVEREMELRAQHAELEHDTQQLETSALWEKNAGLHVQVQDSQVMMPLGPDGQAMTDVEEGGGSENDLEGALKKVWKKKGMKRQTKRINIRPVAQKPKAPPDPSISGKEGLEDAGVPDSQALEAADDKATASPKKSKQKVNPQAHANYRRLKIKNKGSKGQRRGRFGRGRK